MQLTSARPGLRMGGVSAPRGVVSVPGLLRVAVAAFALGWLVLLRPGTLGGPAEYVIVSGTSMEPTLHAGDLAVALRGAEYSVGDVVAYRVPAGDSAAGAHVIHRIVATTGGAYVVRGDNTTGPDLWRPTPADVLGRVAIVVPGAGLVLRVLREPLLVASLLAAATAVYLLPRPRSG